jgi:hypothetical protein
MAQQAVEDTRAAAAAGIPVPTATAVQQLVKKKRKGLQVWAWLYSVAAAAEDSRQVTVGGLLNGATTGNGSSSSSVEPPLAPSRMRRRRTTKQRSNKTNSASGVNADQQEPAAADAPESVHASSYSRVADAVLVLSWRQLQLPQHYPQWGRLMQQQQLCAEWQGPAGSAGAAQAGGGADKAAGAVVALPDAAGQQHAVCTQAAAPALAAAAINEDRSQHLPCSVRLHHSSSSQSWPGGANLALLRQRSKQRLLFGADQCH